MSLVRSVGFRAGLTLTAAAVVTVPLVVAAAPAGAATELVTVKPTGKVVVQLRGNGHAHGMSQYGAQGAAMAGLTYQRILAFYYSGTTLTTLPATNIRVRLSGTGSNAVTVLADAALSVSGVGKLATTGFNEFRLRSGPDDTLILQRHARYWSNVKTGLPSGTAFSTGTGHSVRVFNSSGSTRYWGSVRAVNNGGAVLAVNVVPLDLYTRGVVPYEMPTSWDTAAVSSQAVAARTYGDYAVQHPMNADYDICDTSSCQMYGGYIQYNAAGTRTAFDDPAAVASNQNQVLQYKGSTIFSQFSASNGGWSVAGGQPYLTAHADPYDSARGTDPYTEQSITMPVSKLAAYFGLKTLTQLAVTKRDGNGAWGGRVLAGWVKGTDASNKAKTVTFTGFDLQAAVGAGTTWIRITAAT